MANAKITRLSADPCIGLADLQKAIEDFLLSKPDYNLYGHCAPPKDSMTWKTTPNPTWMSNLSCLVARFLNIAPNTVLPQKKLQVALTHMLNAGTAKNITKKPAADWVDDVCVFIRTVMASYKDIRRDMFKDKKGYDRLMKKASLKEQDLINKVLDSIDINNLKTDAEVLEAGEDDDDDLPEGSGLTTPKLKNLKPPRSWNGKSASSASSLSSSASTTSTRELAEAKSFFATLSSKSSSNLNPDHLSAKSNAHVPKTTANKKLKVMMKSTSAPWTPSPAETTEQIGEDSDFDKEEHQLLKAAEEHNQIEIETVEKQKKERASCKSKSKGTPQEKTCCSHQIHSTNYLQPQSSRCLEQVDGQGKEG